VNVFIGNVINYFREKAGNIWLKIARQRDCKKEE
jgi:hypothetical protein